MVNLNAAQQEAVHHLDSPLLVLAGAGSGKTRVITHKIAWLVDDYGVKPGQIAAITFTNKAAKEMKERVAKLIGARAEGLIVSTFHALGVRILRQEAAKLGLKPGFSILDAADTTALFQELAGSVDKGRLRALQSRISLWKNQLVDPAAALKDAADEIEAAAAELYAAYERTLRAYQAVDFDDLIRLPVQLFSEQDEVAQRWRSRIWHLLVDEYQDTNRGQYRLLQLLTQGRNSFTAVGDDDQSIYAWRGADSENLRLLKEDYPNLRVVKLEQNYRSTARILTAANTLIANNPKLFEKKLWSEHGQGDAIHIQTCRDGDHEAEWVTSRLSAHRFERRTKFSDYAILYRGNHQARAIEQQLRAQRIPYVISGGQSFFERAEIKDITCYLRLLANQDDDPAFIRAVTTPKRGIGGSTLEALGHAAGRRRQSLFACIYAPGLEHRARRQAAHGAARVRRLHQPYRGARRERAGGQGPERPDPGHWLRELVVPVGRGARSRNQMGQRLRLRRMAGSEGRGGKQIPARTGAVGRPAFDAGQERWRAGCGAARYPARRQGPRISPCLPGRRRGGLAATSRFAGAGEDGRGAPPDVRRYHPRPGQPDRELVRAAQAGPRIDATRALALHRRDG
jgi:ATP-dependent DNA helicase Rep